MVLECRARALTPGGRPRAAARAWAASAEANASGAEARRGGEGEAAAAHRVAIPPRAAHGLLARNLRLAGLDLSELRRQRCGRTKGERACLEFESNCVALIATRQLLLFFEHAVRDGTNGRNSRQDWSRATARHGTAQPVPAPVHETTHVLWASPSIPHENVCRFVPQGLPRERACVERVYIHHNHG